MPDSSDGSFVGLSRFLKSKILDREKYAQVALVFFTSGALLTLRFLWYELSMRCRPMERQWFPQLVTALLASASLGYGNFFLLSWAGVYA